MNESNSIQHAWYYCKTDLVAKVIYGTIVLNE